MDPNGESWVLFTLALFAATLGYNEYNLFCMHSAGWNIEEFGNYYDQDDAMLFSGIFGLTVYGASYIPGIIASNPSEMDIFKDGIQNLRDPTPSEKHNSLARWESVGASSWEEWVQMGKDFIVEGTEKLGEGYSLFQQDYKYIITNGWEIGDKVAIWSEHQLVNYYTIPEQFYIDIKMTASRYAWELLIDGSG